MITFRLFHAFCAGDAAQALGPAIMTVFIVFGGYYANASNVPRGLRWIAHTSLIKYAFEAFCVNEFRGLSFVSDRPGRTRSESGEEVHLLLQYILIVSNVPHKVTFMHTCIKYVYEAFCVIEIGELDFVNNKPGFHKISIWGRGSPSFPVPCHDEQLAS